MRYIKLRTVYDCETGELGLALPGSEFSCSFGTLLAHDVIEHQGGVGGICNEFEALGAVWYVRGQFEDISRRTDNQHSAAYHLSGDLLQMAVKYVHGDELEMVSRDTNRHDFDESFSEAIQLAQKDLRYEVDPDEIAQVNMEYFWHRCMGHMRTGARKANSRFRSAMAANSMFWSIADAFPQMRKYNTWYGGDSDLPFQGEGEVWVLAYERNQATIEVSYDDEDYL